MTEHEGTGRAPSAAPPESLDALTDEIERTRHELGETVEALVAKTDVTARTRDKAAEVTRRISGKASQVREQASQVRESASQVRESASQVWEQATAQMSSAGAAAPEPVRRAAKQAAGRVQQRQALIAVAVGGAVLASWIALRQRRR